MKIANERPIIIQDTNCPTNYLQNIFGSNGRNTGICYLAPKCAFANINVTEFVHPLITFSTLKVIPLEDLPSGCLALLSLQIDSFLFCFSFSILFSIISPIKNALSRSQAHVDILFTDTILSYYEREMWESCSLFVNSNLANVGTIYSGDVSGIPSTTDVVLSGSIQLPQGRYIVVLNIGEIEPQHFQQLSIRTGSNAGSTTLVAATKKSSCVITILDLSSDTYVYSFAQMDQKTTINADARFNYLKAIRIK